MHHLPQLRIWYYGAKQKSEVDLLIFVPHGEYRYRIVKHFHDFLKSQKATLCDMDTLYEYCYLDADIGTKTLAHELAKDLVGVLPHYTIAIVDVEVPRNLIDFNREVESAIHEFFKPSPELNHYFVQFYHQLRQKIEDAFKRAKTIFHLHSMASRDLLDSTQNTYLKSPTLLSRYRFMYGGPLRSIDILEKDENSVVQTYQPLNLLAKKLFEAHHYTVAIDKPYSLSENLPIITWLKRFPVPTMAIDFPKYLLCDERLTENYSPLESLPNPQKIHTTAKTLSLIFQQFFREHKGA